MYKVIWLVKFRKDMERDEVLRWWRGRHGDLAGATPGMIRYVQNHWVSPLDPATQLPIQVQTRFLTATRSTGSRAGKPTRRRCKAKNGRRRK